MYLFVDCPIKNLIVLLKACPKSTPNDSLPLVNNIGLVLVWFHMVSVHFNMICLIYECENGFN